ncbi:mechanosensitive ion channel [Microbacterium paludicola]|uniref:Mechanosensitive ion channel n=1 Tax=Microbacterium paludicola TaxID=300019 RepID=A0A4Y9G038_9MICO|nr:mechanosensitive ion channel domain-containing protein [Microbacterium paludicola]MBF0814937.1 mechanosensitive ion channel [Microbacterium paludicola]TFU34664.1 mechanosensitive ion channel [Microbacterium paludicola]
MIHTNTDDTAEKVLTFGEQVLEVLGVIGGKLLWIAITIVVCALIAWVLRLLVRRVVDRIVQGAKSKAKVDDTRALERSPLAAVRLVQRTRTLGSILTNIINTTVVIVAIILIINIINENLLGSFALISAAIGAGLGFGAQNIVKDVLNGMLIVAEDQVGIGDVVDLGLATGVVEFVSVRITHVRDVNGTLWYVRNGEITRIGNMSQGWSRVVIDVGLPADIDVLAVEAALLDTAEELSKDRRWRTRVIGSPEVWGLESVAGETLSIRLVLRAKPSAKDDVAHELRMRLRATVHELGLDLPSLETVTLTGADGALRVRGSNPPRTEPQPLPERPSWRPLGRKKKTTARDEAPLTTPPPGDEGSQDDEPVADGEIDESAPSADAPREAPNGDGDHPGKDRAL